MGETPESLDDEAGLSFSHAQKTVDSSRRVRFFYSAYPGCVRAVVIRQLSASDAQIVEVTTCPYYIILCYIILYHIILYYIILYYIKPRNLSFVGGASSHRPQWHQTRLCNQGFRGLLKTGALSPL